MAKINPHRPPKLTRALRAALREALNCKTATFSGEEYAVCVLLREGMSFGQVANVTSMTRQRLGEFYESLMVRLEAIDARKRRHRAAERFRRENIVGTLKPKPQKGRGKRSSSSAASNKADDSDASDGVLATISGDHSDA